MKYYVTINDKRYEVEVENGEAAIVSTTGITLRTMEDQNTAYIQTAATTTTVITTTSTEQTAEVSSVDVGKEVVKAPLAGVIIDIKVSVGSVVKIGDTLLLLEAMKMENEITSHVDGIVAEIKVAKGANVSTSNVLMILM